MKLTSPEFDDGDMMPERVGYTRENTNPELHISDLPDETESLVLIMDDPDALEPAGKIWDHWIIYDIDPSTEEIKPGENPGTSGITDFKDTGYGGPNPPDGEHTYIFKLYALDSKLNLDEGASKDEVEDEIDQHLIDKAELRGRYK